MRPQLEIDGAVAAHAVLVDRLRRLTADEVGRPSLLLCDEPTGNLDSSNTGSVLELFEDLHEQGLTIVIITHDNNVAGRAGRKVEMTDGELREVG